MGLPCSYDFGNNPICLGRVYPFWYYSGAVNNKKVSVGSQNSENIREILHDIENAMPLFENSWVRHVQAFLSSVIHTIKRIVGCTNQNFKEQRVKEEKQSIQTLNPIF